MTCSNKGLNDILLFMPLRIKNILFEAANKSRNDIREIRLRIDKPIVIVTQNGCSFVCEGGRLTYMLDSSVLRITKEEFEDIFKRICSFSLYSYQDEINKGFITVSGGHRIGLCGTAVKQDDKIISVKNINCLNIRIANEVIGCADSIMAYSFKEKLSNVVLAGPPNSGKTTLLRDLVRQISNGNAGKYYKCVLIDERNEISAGNSERIECNIGENTDVLINYPKAEAIQTAIRTLSPDIIFCDETFSECEAKQIYEGIMCGVAFVITVHAKNEAELYNKNSIKLLTSDGLFDTVYFLGSETRTGKIENIVSLGEKNENSRLKSVVNFDNFNR